MSQQLYPLTFVPIRKGYIWGGRRILDLYGRPGGPARWAESWEVADRAPDLSVVANGVRQGQTLEQVKTEWGAALFGSRVKPGKFPLLVKIIDARERLSVQVHPDEVSAAAVGGEPKTEMWCALDPLPDAYVWAGLRPGVDEKAFREALRCKKMEAVLRKYPVRAGDAIFIPGGRIHAIGEGCLLLEVQQNSDTTFRVYDWDRSDHQGRPRPLHLDQAFRVINWNDAAPAQIEPRRVGSSESGSVEELLASPFFRVERLTCARPQTFANDGGSFHILFASRGAVRIVGDGFEESARCGTTFLLPAGISSYTLVPGADPVQVLRIGMP